MHPLPLRSLKLSFACVCMRLQHIALIRRGMTEKSDPARALQPRHLRSVQSKACYTVRLRRASGSTRSKHMQTLKGESQAQL